MSVGTNVKRYREEKNWSIEDLAKEVNLTASECEKIEAGERIVSSVEIMRICKALGLTIDALFAEPAEESEPKGVDIPEEGGSVIMPVNELEALLSAMKNNE